MDRPKALALSMSITGVVAAATAAVALNFGLIDAAKPAPTSPVAAVSGWSGAGSAPVVDAGSPVPLPRFGESDDENHDDEDHASHEADEQHEEDDDD